MVFNQLLSSKISIDTIQNGRKIFKLRIPKKRTGFPKTTFLDTLNFIPLALGNYL